jgi:hypothetical protein
MVSAHAFTQSKRLCSPKRRMIMEGVLAGLLLIVVILELGNTSPAKQNILISSLFIYFSIAIIKKNY